MSLEERIIVDQITVTENDIVLVRQVIIVERDGVELSRNYHRTSYSPGSDISEADPRVQAICNQLWPK